MPFQKLYGRQLNTALVLHFWPCVFICRSRTSRWRRRSDHWRSSTPKQGPPLRSHRMSGTRSSMTSVQQTPTCRFCFPQHCSCTSQRWGRNYSAPVFRSFFTCKAPFSPKQYTHSWTMPRHFSRALWHGVCTQSLVLPQEHEEICNQFGMTDQVGNF